MMYKLSAHNLYLICRFSYLFEAYRGPLYLLIMYPEHMKPQNFRNTLWGISKLRTPLFI